MSSKAKSSKKSPEELIHNVYFELTSQYRKKYGDNTVLLMEVGTFFECYGAKNIETGQITRSIIQQFSYLCDLSIADKHITVDSENKLVMAGFRDYNLDKYLEKMMNVGLTAVVYVQKDNTEKPKEKIRELMGVYSPGTYISCDSDTQSLSNNLLCIWIQPFSSKTVNKIVCGIATVHLFSGTSSLYEYETILSNSSKMSPTNFDELERIVSSTNPSEVLVVSYLSNKQTNAVLQYSGIQTSAIHRVIMEIEEDIQKVEQVVKCSKQTYIQQILGEMYGQEAITLCSEFSQNEIATQAFCYLANYIREHNSNLLTKMTIPNFENISYRVILANHTLKQLSVINGDTTENQSHLSSLLTFLNKASCAMGKRLLKTQLLNPTHNSEWLLNEYERVDNVLKSEEKYESMMDIRKRLGAVRDIEKMLRQIVLRKIYPSSIASMHDSLCRIRKILDIYPDENILQNLENVIQHIETQLIVERCVGMTSMNDGINIIQPTISPILDELEKTNAKNLAIFHGIRDYFNNFMGEACVKIHETEKSGSSLMITRTRMENLKKKLASSGKKGFEVGNVQICMEDIKFHKSSGDSYVLDIPLLNRVLSELLVIKEKMIVEIQRAYQGFLVSMDNVYENMERIIHYVADLDVLQTKAYLAKTNNYCRPVINDSSEKSFFDAFQLRHPLIEHIQQNEIYVSNDLSLGIDKNGVLLFGTNAVGKTSFIRAIGLAIIMAQSGFYVPCTKFEYKPYSAIYSRILGNDNFFKGLSTFAVEMYELRTILKMADENSLILGDELCSGTETESALSIFSAGIENLHKKGSTFLFATHFHEMVEYEEIKCLEKLRLMHMEVHYDRELDALVYDRILKDGSGARTYGLEVCKSLYMDEEFLSRAYQFRSKYFPETRGTLDAKKSVYNAKKIKTVMCEICGQQTSEEIHHLEPQKDASDNGFIGTFHKNHSANLASVCSTCHDKIHNVEKDAKKSKDAPTKIVRKKTTVGYKLLV